ncbi:DUF6879 family protein [Nocardiopsis sp. FIRDI 009]|uniref:DUF6879 family protein n=1 Tax=Nocardiopsis sp. FIRDI 009 TaxID=714197 RepID=UPI000E25CFE2|nr:DUF6879 family protein [Nocardiopsis sp. FIRDI 009]
MRVTSPLAPEIQHLLTEAQTVDRLETLQIYDTDQERRSFDQYLSGQRPDPTPTGQAWAKLIHDSPARFRLVHAVTEPLSDYMRYRLTHTYPAAAAAGEEITILPIPRGTWPWPVRQQDFWLADTTLVAVEHSGAGRFEHADILTAGALVADARAVFSRAWRMAMPLADYMDRHNGVSAVAL